MIFNEIKCHFNTSLGLVGGMHPLHPPCARACQMYLYCTSLVFHIWLSGPLHLLNLNALTRFLRLQTTNWENDEPCE